MECLFTKRELRLLDDLLPESEKNLRQVKRQKMIRQFSRKISKHNMVKDWHMEDIEAKEEALKREKTLAKAVLKKKAKELGMEVESIAFKEVKNKSKLLAEQKPRRFSTDSRSEMGIWRRKSKSPPPSILTNKCTLFIKMAESDAYFPVNIRHKTVQHLMEALQAKCSTFKPYDIVGIFKKNQRGMLFHLDDDMMEFVENHQIFNIELIERCDEPGKFNMTLSEVPA